MFLSLADITLKGQYLVETRKGFPVSHFEFAEAQHEAFELDIIVQELKGKDFVGKKADNYEAVLVNALKKADSSLETKYSTEVPKPVAELSNKLKEEAMNWMTYQNTKEKADQLNEHMKKFDIINEFEEIGLYFTQGTVKLNKIYTIEEIKSLMLEFLQLAPQ